jgi:ribosomal protein L31
MAENTIQFGITVDASTVTAGLSNVNAAFQSSTSAVSSQWSETSSTVVASLKKIADEAENTAGRTKEQMDKASAAAGALGDVVGIKVPDGMQKMLAESELIGPVLEKAFAPLAVIQLVQWIAQAADQLSKFIADTFIYTQADKDAVSQIAQENKVLEELANKTREAARARQLLNAPDQATQIKLRLQFEAEDQGGSADDFKKRIEEINKEMDVLRKQAQETFKFEITDDFGNTISHMEVMTKGARDAEAEIQRLGGILVATHAREKLAEATENLEKDREAKARAAARAAAQEQAARAFMKDLQDQLTAEKQTHLVSIEEELHFWQSKLAAAKKYPDDYRTIQQTIAGIDQQIFAQRASAAQQAEQSQIEANQRATTQILSDAKAENDAIIAHNKELLDAQAELYKADIDEAKVNEQIKVQLAEADLARGKTNKQQEVQAVATAKKEEIQLEIQAWKAIESLYDGEPKKVAEIEGRISKLKAQYRLADAKAVADSAKAMESTYRQLWSSIGNTFKSTIDGLIQGHETVAQAVQKLLSGLLADIANYLEQKAMKEAAALATSIIQKKAEATSDISANSGKSFAAGYADSASLGPAGLAAAPAVAAGAASATMSGGLALLTTLDVGAWKVPFDMPAMVHAGEMVVPRFESDLFRSSLRSGGQPSNITVLVNHSVNAVDAESFQGVIRRHGNMIGNEVARVLRKKGFAVS